MGHPSDDDLIKYSASMEQIKTRFAAAERFLDAGVVYPNVESAALQVRLALETLMLSALLPNRDAVESVAANYAKHKHDRIMKIMRRVNPNFWPKPSTQHYVAPGEWRLDDFTGDFLREDEYSQAWGRLSAWCHATNPLEPLRDLAGGAEMIAQTMKRTINLLNHHNRVLTDPRYQVVCVMHSKQDGRVHTSELEAIGDA